MKLHKIGFLPAERQVEVEEGSSLMRFMHELGVQSDFVCGGNGRCGKCRVRITAGDSVPTVRDQEIISVKELEQGIRLACAIKVYGDLTIELINSKNLQHNILLEGEERVYRAEPHFKKVFLEVEKPSLDRHRSDWGRLTDKLQEAGYTNLNLNPSLSILRQMPDTLRVTEHRITTLLYNNTVIGVEGQDTRGTMLGIAFDIGTTTIVGYLLDLYSGKEKSVVSTLNPQTKFGADVISRITYSKQENGLKSLHEAVIEGINRLIGEAAEKAGISRYHIYAVSIAANTSMHHLFLGINPQRIAVAPYVSCTSEALVANPVELKLEINPFGKIFSLPNIAGFVGADTVAVLLASELDRSEDIKLVIDIGTNGEIALGSKKKIVACSAAAGPAFEGAEISSGMRGAAGAIDHVSFTDRLEFSVIGGGKPQGICGSALLDTVAGLVELGIIDNRGWFLEFGKITNSAANNFQKNIINYDGRTAFMLATAAETTHGRPILITQDDIRQLQLAKGAMAAGVRVLMETFGVDSEDIKEVLLAGAFGNYLTPHSACVIGLIPQELEDKIKMIGNAAGTGSKLALLSTSEFRRAAVIARDVEFVELGSYPKFNRIFAECTYFNIK